MPRYYTVEEANRTLPLVRRIVTDIVAAHGERAELIKEYGHLDHDLETMKERRRELDGLLQELTDRINAHIDELENIGVVFKGFEPGLVDFYAMMDDREVFLCWKLGEAQVDYWHELDAGYAGRQLLPGHVVDEDEDDGDGDGDGDRDGDADAEGDGEE
ncbi:MAG: DUF2203 family protein [Gemmatimonadetes bacterium]|nr:DUF2203 family protein [Gemmatimonadota bacterium]NIO31009.1 DUF2203 family protein [Gemmatimonadota bacterium]